MKITRHPLKFLRRNERTLTLIIGGITFFLLLLMSLKVMFAEYMRLIRWDYVIDNSGVAALIFSIFIWRSDKNRSENEDHIRREEKAFAKLDAVERQLLLHSHPTIEKDLITLEQLLQELKQTCIRLGAQMHQTDLDLYTRKRVTILEEKLEQYLSAGSVSD
jgi:hypothetical protein